VRKSLVIRFGGLDCNVKAEGSFDVVSCMIKANLRIREAVRAKIFPNTDVRTPQQAFTLIELLVVIAILLP
jgi:prepilin-type N-terminal cleavage/methylation domain-containing protein